MNPSESAWRALMLRGLDGDASAYNCLLHQLSVRLRAFVAARLGALERGAAEDIVQETLLAIHSYRDRYDPTKPLTPWVYAIARYKLVDHLRRAKRGGVKVPIDGVEEILVQEEPEEIAPARDVAALLGRLRPRQQMAIRLVKLESMSVKEAAAKMNMSESAIKVSVHRGIKQLAALVARSNMP